MSSTAETTQINNDDKTEININENEETQMTTQSQALGVLLNAIEIAQRRGAFNLEEAELLCRAKKMFIKQDQSEKK